MANRYARALLDVALKESDPQQVERDLGAFADLMQQHATLGQVLTNPAVPVQRKRAIVDDLLKSGGLQPVVTKLLIYLAERDRLSLMRELMAAYRDRLMDHLKVVRADVTSAVELPEDRVRALAQSLGTATGRHVTVTTRVDPSILGGVVARVGSVVYDGSVATQLERMKQQLSESGT
jgi:F-type H+-transporting ATPase subunit delta